MTPHTDTSLAAGAALAPCAANDMGQPPLLAAKGLAKRFHGIEVLRAVDLCVGPGEIVALYGPNGVGKTTLLRILATLLRPQQGTLAIDGINAFEEKALARQKLLFLGHGTQLYEDLPAEDNLRFFLALRERPQPHTDQALRAVLEQVELWKFRKFAVAQYSAGMKRRLSLAKAMLVQPPLLLLDEPYTSLDKAGVSLLNDFLAESAAAGRAVVMVSHSPELLVGLSHRALWLRAGRLAEGRDVEVGGDVV